jgi:hypothetical protein
MPVSEKFLQSLRDGTFDSYYVRGSENVHLIPPVSVADLQAVLDAGILKYPITTLWWFGCGFIPDCAPLLAKIISGLKLTTLNLNGNLPFCHMLR